MKVFMFPGQGAQDKGMGGALFDEFRELTEAADDILGYSIKELCLTDPRGELGRTQFTQVALYTVGALSYFKKLQSRERPDFLIGHSLGEYNALFAAECFDFETGLHLVKKRGELMSRAVDGAMAAILGASKEDIEAILADNGLTEIDLANYNTPSQIVISGARDQMIAAEPLFQKAKIRFVPLNTSGAFHSRFMQPAAVEFETFLREFTLRDPRIPVIANVTARPYAPGEVGSNLVKQIASTVKWSESIQYLLSLEEGASEPMELVELGHGDVLTRLALQIKQQTPRNTPAPSVSSTPVVPSVSALPPASVVPSVSMVPPAGSSAAATSRDDRADAAPAPAEPIGVEDKVAAWNARHPIGTKVRSLVLDYDDLETRTDAMVLFGRRAAIYMKGYEGYFDLDEIAPR